MPVSMTRSWPSILHGEECNVEGGKKRWKAVAQASATNLNPGSRITGTGRHFWHNLISVSGVFGYLSLPCGPCQSGQSRQREFDEQFSSSHTPTTARCLFTSPEPRFLLDAICTFIAIWHCVQGPPVPEMVADRIVPGLAIQDLLHRYGISRLTRSKQTHRGMEHHCPWGRPHNRWEHPGLWKWMCHSLGALEQLL